LYPGWFKNGSAVNMPHSDRCCKNAQDKAGQKPKSKGYQYKRLSDNFKVIVMNFKPVCRKNRTCLEL